MIFILTLVYQCTLQNIDLVSSDYYDHEIKYQERIDQEANYIEINDTLSISQNNNQLVISYPSTFIKKNIVGNVAFFKPDNAKADFEVPISYDDALNQRVSKSKLVKGKWKINVSFNVENKNYFTSENIFITDSN